MQLSGDETKHTTVGDVKIVQNQMFSLLGWHPRANDPGRWKQQTNWKFRKQILFLFYFVFFSYSCSTIVWRHRRAFYRRSFQLFALKNKTFLPKPEKRIRVIRNGRLCTVRYIISVCQSRALLLPIYNK
jgi:hypothetical protein